MTYEPDIYRAHDDMRILGAIRDLATTAERSIDKITDRLAEANHELDRVRGKNNEAVNLIRKAGGAVQSGATNLALFDLNDALAALGQPRAFTAVDSNEQTDTTDQTV